LRIRLAREPIKLLVAETQFSLARALWDASGDRLRALRLATSAKMGLASHMNPRRERPVIEWLATHHLAHP
jgi:hypothetical protein